MSWISARRELLDRLLESYFLSPVWREKRVLDVGGSRSRRGRFNVDSTQFKEWIIINRDQKVKPDLCVEFPPLPYEKDSFDCCLCTEVLEYMQDPEHLIREMLRVTKAQGEVVISAPFLHPLHGDPQQDRFRFTESYFNRLAEKLAVPVQISRMGGTLEVIVDLIVLAVRRQGSERNILCRGFVYLLKLLTGPFLRQIRKPREITTGFWVVFKKH